MPRPSDSDQFHGRHHAVVVLLIVIACAVILYRLGSGWHQAGEGDTDPRIALRFDPNTASVQELAAIPGVGRGLAERIVMYRERQRVAGRDRAFITLSDLDQVEGIGEGTLEAISPYLHIGAGKP